MPISLPFRVAIPLSEPPGVANHAIRLRYRYAPASPGQDPTPAALLRPRQRHTLNPQRRRIDAVAQIQIIGGGEPQEHVLQITRNRDFGDRIGQLPILDPEACRAAAVVAG